MALSDYSTKSLDQTYIKWISETTINCIKFENLHIFTKIEKWKASPQVYVNFHQVQFSR